MLADPAEFRRSLLAWYAHHQRPLPWRHQPGLYKTVVSEFMLQQTRVETVLPYFARWMNAFPDFSSLAAAPESSVLQLWEGLGYYSRARNLHRLARSLENEGYPQSFSEWCQRPGIGPYTAAAICSIVYGIPEPVIDGNVVRVLARLTDYRDPIPSQTAARTRFAECARSLIDPAAPGDFNQAMMELGATICRKQRPACLLCPVRQHCAGCAAGIAEQLPRLASKPPSRRIVPRLFLKHNNYLLLQTYPQNASRLAGFSELPALSAPPENVEPLLNRSRGISSERIREPVYALPPDHPLCQHVPDQPDVAWHPLHQLPVLSGPHKRWIHHLLQHS